MTLSNTYSAFLALIRLGVGNPSSGIPSEVDWLEIRALAEQHGLSAIVLDGIEKLPEKSRPPKGVLLQWIAETLQVYERRFELYCHSIADLAEFYNSHGFKMMVIKGYACSLDWPKPAHRPCGDIDIWLFGRQKEADALLAKERSVSIDSSHLHHTVFDWKGFTVENHYDYINVYHHKSNVSYEKLLKKLGADDSYFVELFGEKVYFPSPNLNALFLLKHLMMHFASEGINLRQLMDWAYFVKAHGNSVDWETVFGVLEEYGMKEMFNMLNAICVEDLGFEPTVFPQVQFNPSLKERVLNEILTPEFSNQMPRPLFKRVLFKFRRWQGSAWKHELCYKESMWSAFWSGLWAHLLKPASI